MLNVLLPIENVIMEEQWNLSRRSDAVVKKERSRELARWLTGNSELLLEHITEMNIERLQRRIEQASNEANDVESHRALSKAVAQFIPRDKWLLIRRKFYKHLESVSRKYSTVMLSSDVKKQLERYKKKEGYDSYNEAVDALLSENSCWYR